MNPRASVRGSSGVEPCPQQALLRGDFLRPHVGSSASPSPGCSVLSRSSDRLGASFSTGVWRCCPFSGSSRTRRSGSRDTQPLFGPFGALTATSRLVLNAGGGRGEVGTAFCPLEALHRPIQTHGVGHSDRNLYKRPTKARASGVP